MCVFVCVSTVLSSVFGKSSHFPFPYFMLLFKMIVKSFIAHDSVSQVNLFTAERQLRTEPINNGKASLLFKMTLKKFKNCHVYYLQREKRQ